MPVIISAKDLAKLCHVHYRTVLYWVLKGKITPNFIKEDKNGVSKQFLFLDDNVEEIVNTYGK